MGTRFAPEELTVLDPGNVPEIWVDGSAYYIEKNGIVHRGFYVLEPVMPLLGEACPITQALLCFRLRCTIAVQEAMRAQIMRLQRLTDSTIS